MLIGNGLAGSRLMLDHILCGWSVDAATALGSVEQWSTALRQAYHLPTTHPNEVALESLSEEASRGDRPIGDLTPGAAVEEADHRHSHLYYSLYEVGESLGGQALGRDFVMRLGEDGFTPDAMFFENRELNTLHEYYLEGPAELVIEVASPASRDYDKHAKRDRYARAGVPEYIIADPAKKEADFLQLASGAYIRREPDGDGLYRPRSVPGLAISPRSLWAASPHGPFNVERSRPPARRRARSGLGWGERRFAPRLDLEPVALTFAEYICWCPEAKFEFWDGRVQLGSDEGVRNVLGMLLATLGLVEACRFAAPGAWISALKRRRDLEARDGEVRRDWRRRVMEAANVLRAEYDPERIAVTGDLLLPGPLNYWSRPELAVWGLPLQELLRVQDLLSRMGIELIEGDHPWFSKKIGQGKVILEDI